MNKSDYSDERIIKNSWPAWTPVEGGGSVRCWVFEFENPLSDEQVSPEGLSDQDLQVAVARGAQSSELILRVTTYGNPYSDDVFFTAFYRLFERLEGKCGQLKAIQGQPRNLWRPFRPAISHDSR
jgi:hypothetical protein